MAVERTVKVMSHPRPRFLSVVVKGANKRGWRAFKKDGCDEELDMPDSRKKVVKQIADRAIKMMRDIVGTSSPDEIEVKLATQGLERRDVLGLAFDAEHFDADAAGAWATEHGFKADEVEQDENGLLLRQAEAPADAECVTVMLDDEQGIAAIARKTALESHQTQQTGPLKSQTPTSSTQSVQSIGSTTNTQKASDARVVFKMGEHLPRTFDLAIAEAGAAPTLHDALWALQRTAAGIFAADASQVPNRQAALKAETQKAVAFVHDLLAALPARKSEAELHAVAFDKAWFADESAVRTWKSAEGLAAHYGDEAHPFTACMNDPKMASQYPDEEQRKLVCGKMKGMLKADLAPLYARVGTLPEAIGSARDVFYLGADPAQLGDDVRAVKLDDGVKAYVTALAAEGPVVTLKTVTDIATAAAATLAGAFNGSAEGGDDMDIKALTPVIKAAIDEKIGPLAARLSALEGGETTKKGDGTDAALPGMSADETKAIKSAFRDLLAEALAPVVERVEKLEAHGPRRVISRKGASETGETERRRAGDEDEESTFGGLRFGSRLSR